MELNEFKAITQQTIYTFDNYDQAKQFCERTPDSRLSSPRHGVYNVIVEHVLYRAEGAERV